MLGSLDFGENPKVTNREIIFEFFEFQPMLYLGVIGIEVSDKPNFRTSVTRSAVYKMNKIVSAALSPAEHLRSSERLKNM